jgi:O-antigen/teichoic acid export membrane protein
MISSLLRAGLPPLIAVVTLPIVLGHLSLDDYGLWATVTGLIAVLAAVDVGLSTVVARQVATARGVDNAAEVLAATRSGVSVALRLGVLVMPLTAAAGWLIVPLIAGGTNRAEAMWLWVAVVGYQAVGWYFAMQAAVATGLQRGDLANAVNAAGAVAGALVTVVAVVAGTGLVGMVAGLWTLGVVTLAGHMRNARRLTGTRRVWRPRHRPGARSLLVAGLALATMQASLLVEPAVAKALLSAFDGPEAAAAMQLGFTVSRMALVAAMAPTAAILVGVAEWRDSQPERVAGLVRNASYASLALVSVLAAVMLATGPYVAAAWLGVDVPGIGVAIRTLSVVTIATIVVWLFSQTLLGFGHTRPVTIRLAIGTAVALAGMAAAAPVVGLPGVVAASFLGAAVAAVLLARLDADYGRIIFSAAGRIGPAMVVLGVLGALLIDRINPQTRITALLAAVVATLVAAAAAWLLIPSGTRHLMQATLAERLPFGRRPAR